MSKVFTIFGKKQSKEAFTGIKASDGMYWCKDKKRYIFPGNEDESEEEDTGPPPMAKKPVEVEKPKEPQGGASDLMAVALPAHLRNRKAKGKPVATQPKPTV
jgi:hypothetical protein